MAIFTALTILFLVTVGYRVATRSLWDPDEGRNAEVAREMAETGDFIVPHLNGLPYLDKPVFHFAASAVSIKALGPTELGARLPSLLFALATGLLVAAFGRHLFNRENGLLAGLAFMTSPLLLGYSSIVIFDATFTFWVACTCMAFFRAWESDRRIWWVAAWAASGFAVLTKGPVGLVLPLVVNVAYAIVRKGGFRRLFHPAGLIAFVIVVIPWFLAVTARHPEFPHYAFVVETFQRVSTDKLARTGSFYYFIPFLLVGAFPWSLLPLFGIHRLLKLVRERRGAERPVAYLLLWIVVPFVLFSISQSQRPGYVLPLFPPLALLAGRLFQESAPRKWAAGFTAAFAGVFGCGLFLFSKGIIVFEKLTEKIQNEPGMTEWLSASAPMLGVVCFVAAMLILLDLRRSAPRMTVMGMALLPLLCFFIVQDAVGLAGRNRSADPIAEAVRAKAPKDVRLVGIDVYSHSLAYNLGSRMIIATQDAAELRSNYISHYSADLRELPDSPLKPADWWRSALKDCTAPTIFIIKTRSKSLFSELEALPLLSETRRHAAYGPCGEGTR